MPASKHPNGGGVEVRGTKQFRARKARQNRKTLVGQWRPSWHEAYQDLDTLHWSETDQMKPTLRQFILSQLADRKREVAPATYLREETHFRSRIAASDLGKMAIDKITDVDCQKFLDAQKFKIRFEPLRGDDGKVIWAAGPKGRKFQRGRYVMTNTPLGPGGARAVAKTLAVYFKRARSKRHRLIRQSPLVGMEYPRAPATDYRPNRAIDPPTAAGMEVNLFGFLTKIHAQGERFAVMVMTLLEVGIRPGELRGLKHYHLVDNHDGAFTLVLENARSRTFGGERDWTTKTGKVSRLAIDEETYDRMRQLPRHKNSDYIFHTRSGRPVDKRNFNKEFAKFRDAAGLPHLTPTGLRHTYASLLLRAGVDLKTVQARLTHSSPAMVMRIYGEAFGEATAEAPAKLRALLDSHRKAAN